MPSILELEIKNLPKEFKEDLYNFLKANPNSKIELSQDWEKTGNLEALDEALENYFLHHYDKFITLRRVYKNSLYNQYGKNWWYWKPRLLSRYIKFKSSSSYIKFKKLKSSSSWKTFWKFFNIITMPIQFLFDIIAFILCDFVAPFLSRFLQIILGLIAIGDIIARIVHLVTWLASL